MKSLVISIIFIALVSVSSSNFFAQQNKRADLDKIEQSLKDDVPRVLCLTRDLATGGQPSEQAFGKLAANGFRSVLNLRTAAEGVDLDKERANVEGAGMRYLHIPVAGNAPRAEQAEAFIRALKEKDNHPMFIHCASANRVGAFMMIYRVLELRWTEEKALEEAVQIGLRSEALKEFARKYIEQQQTKRKS